MCLLSLLFNRTLICSNWGEEASLMNNTKFKYIEIGPPKPDQQNVA